MQTHRLFSCLFPVLAVATLLHSGLFAPGPGESVTGRPTAQLISLDDSPVSASQNADQKTDELIDLGVDPVGVSQSNDQFTDLFGSASASPTFINSDTVPHKITQEEWENFFAKQEKDTAEAQPMPPVSEGAASSLQGAAGGASADPNAEELKRLSIENEVLRLRAENEALRARQATAQRSQPTGG